MSKLAESLSAQSVGKCERLGVIVYNDDQNQYMKRISQSFTTSMGQRSCQRWASP